MNTKCYRLAKDEELPDEFCAVRDIGGEPSEYAFYVPEAENAKLREENERFIIKLNAEHIARQNVEADNAKLRKACAELLKMAERHDPEWLHWPELHDELRKLGVKVVKL